MAEMRSARHAEILRRETREAVARYRAAKADYEANLNFYRDELLTELDLPFGARLSNEQETLARQRADNDPRQQAASSRCRYFMDEVQAFGIAYLVESNWAANHEMAQPYIAGGNYPR